MSGPATGPDDSGDLHEGDLLLTILSAIVREADPVVRWHLVSQLSGRLDWLRALTVRQLLQTGMSQKQAGDAIGVTRGRINQLAGKAPVDDAAFAWGQALAVAGQLAALADRPGATRFVDDYAGLVTIGLSTQRVWADLEDAAPAWVAAARRRGHPDTADTLMRRMAELLGAATDLPDELTIEQVGAVALGFHHERSSTAS